MLLEVENLQTSFRTAAGFLRAVDGFSFHVADGETVALVGESGCGKTATALSLLGLIPPSQGVIAGTVRWRGTDLFALGDRAMRDIRGKEIGMIFQDPSASLNPVLTIGHQIGEILRRHQQLDRRAATERAVDLLDLVGVPEPHQCLRDYPHRLSGGLQQRVTLALAMACNPKLLIADEPTSALDATIQAQILDLITRLKRSTGVAILLITHDIGVVAEIADRVMVMFAGRKVEDAPVADLFRSPRHPYTLALLAAAPRLQRSSGNESNQGAGSPAFGASRISASGCTYAARCPLATDLCRTLAPVVETKAQQHFVACHFASREASAA